MQRHSWTGRAVKFGGVAFLLAGSIVGMARIAAAQQPSQAVPLDDARWAIEHLKADAAAPPAKVSRFWLGIGSEPVPEALQAQMKLPKNLGLLVVEVLPESPAAAAKLQRFDVLVKAGDKPLAKLEDLMEALDASQGRKMTLEIVRAGRTTSVEITPAKRPPEFAPKAQHPMDSELRKWLEQAQPGRPLRFRWMQPGVLLPSGTSVPSPMPADMTVTITKKGDKPAKIAVSQGDKKWETTEDELDQLPPEIRPHVERLLGRMTIGSGQPGTVDMVPDWSQWFGNEDRVPGQPGTESQKQLDKHLDEMNRQLDQLRKAVEELKARQANPPESER